jgi:transcriptional regulator with XRE-family HTH domain
LSQAELGARDGRAQTQIARWERDAVSPSLETVRELVRACGFELTLGLAARDDSYAIDAAERLALTPPAHLARSLEAANAVRVWGCVNPACVENRRQRRLRPATRAEPPLGI